MCHVLYSVQYTVDYNLYPFHPCAPQPSLLAVTQGLGLVLAQAETSLAAVQVLVSTGYWSALYRYWSTTVYTVCTVAVQVLETNTVAHKVGD